MRVCSPRRSGLAQLQRFGVGSVTPKEADWEIVRWILPGFARGLVQGGDLKDRKFDEFWKSQARKDDMGALDARGCERCQFNEKNRALLYVMGNTESDTTSRHIEWP